MIFGIMYSLVYNHLKGEDCFRYLRTSLFISAETVGPPCFYRSPEWTNQTLNQKDRTRGISLMAASQIDATILHTGPFNWKYLNLKNFAISSTIATGLVLWTLMASFPSLETQLTIQLCEKNTRILQIPNQSHINPILTWRSLLIDLQHCPQWAYIISVCPVRGIPPVAPLKLLSFFLC